MLFFFLTNFLDVLTKTFRENWILFIKILKIVLKFWGKFSQFFDTAKFNKKKPWYLPMVG
jgi:hypothetical protein